MNVVVLGRPGAGKGTQSKRIEKHFGLRHLSTGELLRAAKQQDTPLGRQIADRIDQGNLVTDELAMSLVEQTIKPQPHCGYVFDGIPRTLNQGRMLSDLLAGLGTQVDLAIELHVGQEMVRDRLLERATKEGRGDDTLQTIRQRLAVYEAQTSPLIAFYREAGLLRSVDGAGSPDEVFELIRRQLDAS
ncbi:MAG: adenylate kinase [Pirellulaceae bacterium]